MKLKKIEQISKIISLKIVCVGLSLSATSCQKIDDVADKTLKTLAKKNSVMTNTYCKSGLNHLSPKAAAKREAFLESMPGLNKGDSRSLKSIGNKKKIGVVFKFVFDMDTFNQNTIKDRNVRASAEKQIRILNEGFNSSSLPVNSRLDIEFQLDDVVIHWVGSDYLVEPNETSGFNNNEYAMDFPRTKLNIYVVPAHSWPDTSGWASDLWETGLATGNGAPFHVILNQVSFSDWGGLNSLNKLQDLNSGKTIIHQVGHFLGLEHPFYGFGCKDNDQIADTPRQSYQQIQNSVGETAKLRLTKDLPVNRGKMHHYL